MQPATENTETGQDTRSDRPALSPVEQAIWDEMQRRGWAPAAPVYADQKTALAAAAGSTSAGVSVALASIRKKLGVVAIGTPGSANGQNGVAHHPATAYGMAGDATALRSPEAEAMAEEIEGSVPATPAQMHCGHPPSDVENSDEGTSFCRSCARESLEVAAGDHRRRELESLRAQLAEAFANADRDCRALAAERDDWQRRALAAEDLVRPATPRPLMPAPCACPEIALSLAERRVVLQVAHQLANDATLALDFDGLEWPVRCAILSEAIFIVAGLLGDEA